MVSEVWARVRQSAAAPSPAAWGQMVLGRSLLRRSTGSVITSGERWIRTTMSSISSCRSRRNKQAAKKFFGKLLKGCQYVPRVIITDKLKSYGAAKREILPGVEHRQSAISITGVRTRIGRHASASVACRGLNQQVMPSVSLSAYGTIAQHFRPRRHLLYCTAASTSRDEQSLRELGRDYGCGAGRLGSR